MLAILLSAALRQEAPRVSVEIRARPVAEAVRELAKAAGLRLGVRSPISGSIVLLVARNQPVESVLAHLATAVDGEWMRDGNTRILTRSPERTRQLVGEDQALRLSAWRRYLATNPAPVQFKSADDVLLQALHDLGAERLCGMSPGKAQVFSDHPAGGQRALPSATVTLIKGLDARNLSSAATEYLRKDPALAAGNAPLKLISRAHLAVTPQSNGAGTELALYAPDGSLLASEVRPIRLTFDPQPFTLAFPNRRSPLSPSSVRWLQALGALPSQDGWQPGKEEAAWFTDPERFDPLGFQVCDAFTGLAPTEGSVAACLPEEAMSAARGTVTEAGIDAPRILRTLVVSGKVRAESSGGWLTISPVNAVSMERSRLSRSALGRACRSAMTAGCLNLRTQGVFAFESAGASSDVYLRQFEGLKRFGVRRPYPGLSPSLLAFIGGLSDAQWKRLLGGDSLEVAAVPGDAQEWLRQALAVPVSLARTSDARGQGIPDLWLGAWEPPGPGNSVAGTISLSTHRAAGLDATDQGPYLAGSRSVSYSDLADSLAGNPALPTDKAAALVADRFRMGSIRFLRIHIAFAGGMVLEGECEEGFEPGDSATYLPYQELPSAVRQDIEKRATALRLARSSPPP